MQLTKEQIQALNIYRWYRQHPPSWQIYLIAMIWRSSYLIFLGIFGVAVVVLLLNRFTALGVWIYLFLGVLIGIVARTLLAYRQTVQLWPVLEQIIDWEKVEALLQASTSPSEQPLEHL